jgi:hypothetical protein
VEIVVDPRFNGPPGSGNGGYTCGLVAPLAGGPVEVTLRLPPPLGRPLAVTESDGRTVVHDGEALVAEAVPTELALEPPEPVGFEQATEASARYPGFDQHAFPTCFVCGPDRTDGLRIFAGPVTGRELVASPWRPDRSLANVDGNVAEEFVWAALDCPGAFAVGFSERGETVLGRLAARIDRTPAVGEPCVVVGWPLGEEGRKLYAGTALFSEDGELYAVARATWIVPA